MCLRVGRVDHLDLGVLGLRGQLSHDRGKHAHPAPTLPTVEGGLWRAIGGRRIFHINPLDCMKNNVGQNPPVIDPRLTTELQKIRAQSVNLRFGQPKKIAHNTSLLWEFVLRRKPPPKPIYGS